MLALFAFCSVKTMHVVSDGMTVAAQPEPVALVLKKSSHGLARDGSGTSALRDQQLTA
jgi:dTDP-4-amino-4,6-dideoxygalactose transaminase